MKKHVYIFVAIIVLILSWETSLEASSMIPHEAIRVRILAHSDAPQDQWIKRKIRDAMMNEMDRWLTPTGNPIDDIDTARLQLTQQLPQIEKIVAKTLGQYHFSYDFKVEFGDFPLPEKTFDKTVYPAGDYETLRITLGNGAGENWWCVLFPPLCFIDVVVADDSPETNKSKKSKKIKKVASDELQSEDDAKPKVRTASFFKELWTSIFKK